jgi:hypothetical protein
MARPVSKYKIKLRGKEKQELRQAKKQGRKMLVWSSSSDYFLAL